MSLDATPGWGFPRSERIVDPVAAHTPVSNLPTFVDVGPHIETPPTAAASHVDVEAALERLDPRRDRARGDVAAFELQQFENLKDISFDSFGESALMARPLIGGDDRQPVPNTKAYPWSAIALLSITKPDDTPSYGTGFFIGPRTVVTAGHCVYVNNPATPEKNGWVKSITVFAGYSAGTEPPAIGSATSADFHSVSGWTQNANRSYDYGAIRLSTNLGSMTGTFGFGVYADSQLVGSTAHLSGYPGDKTPRTQWYDNGTIEWVDPLRIYYDIDMVRGQSGAPVYRIHDGKRYVIAINTHGDLAANFGTRITATVHNNLTSWSA